MKIELTTFEIQEERARKYPVNRIAFMSSEIAAAIDKKNFTEYRKGEITLIDLRLRTGKNNHIPTPSETAMLNELKLLGWLGGLHGED